MSTPSAVRPIANRPMRLDTAGMHLRSILDAGHPMSRADTTCRRCRQPASTCDVDPDACRLLLHKLGRCGMGCEHCPDDAS